MRPCRSLSLSPKYKSTAFMACWANMSLSVCAFCAFGSQTRALVFASLLLAYRCAQGFFFCRAAVHFNPTVFFRGTGTGTTVLSHF